MTEDPRISEIRAVLTEYVRTDDLDALWDVRCRIRAIVDREAPAPEPWQAEARIRDQRATSLGYCEHVVETYPDGEEDTCSNLRRQGEVTCEEHASGPRVFFPGDTVPAGTWVMNDSATETRLLVGHPDHDWRVMFGPCVEVHGLPTPDEWQAAVDRADAARTTAELQQAEGTSP